MGFIKNSGKHKLYNDLRSQWVLYLFMVPAIAATLVFSYRPMYGVIMAFQKYDIIKGIMGSEFIGLRNFVSFFSDNRFYAALYNTIALGCLGLLCFPIPVIFAVLINEYKFRKIKRVVQSVTYLPHFISWVIISGLLYRLLDQDSGAINVFLNAIGVEAIPFFREPAYFWWIYILAGIWKDTGWNSILYLSAMTAINPETYEAAIVDGANRMQRIWNITIPGIMPTLVMLLILRISAFFNGNFEALFAMRNPMVSIRSDNVEIFTYFRGVIGGEYGYATAIGFSQSVMAIALLFIANKGLKKITGYSLF